MFLIFTALQNSKIYQNPTNNFEDEHVSGLNVMISICIQFLSSHSYNFLDIAVDSNMKNKFSMLM